MSFVVTIAAASLGCGSSSDDSKQTVELRGPWFSTTDYSQRGMFRASLEVGSHQVDGTVEFNGHPLGTMAMHGTLGKEYSGSPPQTYLNVNLVDSSGSVQLGWLAYGTSTLATDTLLYGSLIQESSNTHLAVFNIPPDRPVLPVETAGPMDPSLHVSAIALSDSGEMWVTAIQEQSTKSSVFKLDASGSILQTATPSCLGSTLAWGDGKLWSIGSGNLCRLSQQDLTVESELPIAGAKGSVNALAFANGQLWLLAGIVQMELWTVDTQGQTTGTVPGSNLTDCRGFTVTSSNIVCASASRDGSLPTIRVLNLQGALLRTYTPMSAGETIGTDGTALYQVSSRPPSFTRAVIPQ